jgi:hypothetical protein
MKRCARGLGLREWSLGKAHSVEVKTAAFVKIGLKVSKSGGVLFANESQPWDPSMPFFDLKWDVWERRSTAALGD